MLAEEAVVSFKPQSVQTVDPVVLLYLPVPHVVHVPEEVAPTAAEDLPAPHAVHVPEEVAPSAVEYLPATQSVQLMDPAVLYLPASHSVHVSEEVAPSAVEYLPALQSVQSYSPMVGLYVPRSQLTQPPLSKKYPATHTQAEELVLPEEAVVSREPQSVQTVDPV